MALAAITLERIEKMERVIRAAREMYTAHMVFVGGGPPTFDDRMDAALAAEALHDELLALDGKEPS